MLRENRTSIIKRRHAFIEAYNEEQVLIPHLEKLMDNFEYLISRDNNTSYAISYNAINFYKGYKMYLSEEVHNSYRSIFESFF